MKELYQKVLDSGKYRENSSICFGIIDCSSLTKQEKRTLKKDFKKRKPTIFSKFWWDKEFKPFSLYWWPSTPAGNDQREKYLKHLINKL